MADYLLSIDQGTTSTRAIVFDRDMVVCGVGQQELELFYPDNGWVEQDSHAIWQDTIAVCRQAVEKAGLTGADIAAVGITNQRETIVLWDKETGQALGNAIVWQDRRTVDVCQTLKDAGHEDMIRSKTGLLLDPYFSGTKLRWMLDNIEGARAKADAGELIAGTMDCFLLWHLTGGKVHATDATNASRTMLFNIVDQIWDEELLSLLDIPLCLLPQVKDCADNFGYMTDDILGTAIPITGIAGDQQAALIGQACFQPGMMKVTYGTGCFALMNIGQKFQESKNRLLTTVAYRLKGQTHYAIEGSVFVAGAAVQWLRDGLKIISSAKETEALAKSVDNTGGVYLVPAFTGLGAPYWDPEARGSITGLTRDTSVAHIVRATLEAQAYQTQDLMTAMADDTEQLPSTLRVDGGMVANNWVCQFLSDMTGLKVDRPKIIETTALGAAYLAGLQIGFFENLDDISKNWGLDKCFEPAMSQGMRDDLYQGWKKAIGRTIS